MHQTTIKNIRINVWNGKKMLNGLICIFSFKKMNTKAHFKNINHVTSHKLTDVHNSF